MPNKTVARHIVIITETMNSGMNRERSVMGLRPFSLSTIRFAPMLDPVHNHHLFFVINKVVASN